MDFLFQTPRNDLELAVVLEHLTGDVEAQILRIDQTLHKAETVGQQVRALLHNQHAGGIELEPFFILATVVVIRRAGRDEQQCVIGRCALGAAVDHPHRVLIIKEFVLIEIVVILIGDLGFALLPNRHHAVKRLVHRILFILGLVLRAALLDAGCRHIHPNRVADIVGVFFHDARNPMRLEELVIALLALVLLDDQRNLGAMPFLLTFLDRVAIRAVRLPAERLFRTKRLAHHGDTGCDHKRRIKPDAELPDYVDLIVFLVLLLERQRTTLGNGAEIALQLLSGHSAAVVGDLQGAGILVHHKVDRKIRAGEASCTIRQRMVIELVDRVGRVGDQLAQEDFPMGVDRVDHQVEQAFGFRLKLLCLHKTIHPLFSMFKKTK